MPEPSTLDLVVGLSRSAERAIAADKLAARLGAEAVLLLVRDAALGALIPAPGMPQTLRGGRTWKSFLADCPPHGRCTGTVELPKGTPRPGLALILEGTAIVLIGGTPVETEIAEVERLLPLIAALLASEQDAVLARAEAGAAKDAASRAEALASALDAARADASTLNAELREEERRKDEFLAMLGHELRNPLSPLVNGITLLRMQGPDKPVPAELTDLMARQTAQLSRLVDDLLDVSRVSRGRVELRREHLPLRDVISNALDESRPLLDAHRHEVVVTDTDTPLYVNGDRARLVQVFGNLFNNAAKYTDPGGRITVTITRDEQNAIVRVQDTGIGISAEMKPHIFDLFAQARAALGRAEGGLGIGLTLVRRLVELHGGRVSVESAGIGQGASFSVSLPLVTSARPAIEPSALRIDTMAIENALRVLIVDDNRDAADSMAALLRLMGHQVEVAYDGQAALELRSTAEADLVFLDIGLPGLDGYDLARRLRSSTKAGARLVALTGFGTDERKRRSKEAGFDEHVVKPATREVLDGLIRSATPASRRATPETSR